MIKTKEAMMGIIAISCIITVGAATVRSIFTLSVSIKNVEGR
jgi:hypothetical protein